MSESRFAKFKIKKFRKEIEPQEILLDSLAQEKEIEMGISEKRLEIPFSQKALQGLWIVFLILIFILFGKTLQLQFLEGKTFSELSKENEFVIRLIQAERGVIYDKDLKQLVFNKPSFDLICQISDLPKDENQRKEILKAISQILQEDYDELLEKINTSDSPQVLVAENLEHQTLILLESRINEFPGFEIENNTVREYLAGSVFSHIVGYKRRTEEKTGLEKQYDDILQAKPGELQVKRDAHGNPISKEIISEPESGKSLVLYLDSELQEKIIKSLEKSIKRVGAKSGAVVALDPKTGGVLALVSYPGFDNNLFSQGISQEEWQEIYKDPNEPLFNRAISGIGYPTGSIIKPLVGLAALEEEVITALTKIYSPLEICIQNPWFSGKEDCYADWKYHGTSNLKRAIAESVNTFFYQIGGGYEGFQGLGVTKIKKWLKAFGWGAKTEIDLPKEGKGILPDTENDWRLGDTYHLSIGQGPFSVTPLQVAVAFAAISNGGNLYQPKVVKEIIDIRKKVIEKTEPRILREITLKLENLEVVRQGMRQAVTSLDGSSYILSSLPVAVAAKTGTAQTGKEEVYHNWVTVFAPYKDPKIVLTVIIENVEGVQAAALPVAREVLEWYFTEHSRP